MIITKQLFLHFSLVAFLIGANEIETKLDLVQVFFRHGDRTPQKLEFYPKDPYNLTVYEPYGLGQLTNEGKRREFRLGEELRKNYDNFLGTYRPGDVYARSTNTDRTKMSLLATLAGLYPPTGRLIWNGKLNWMPIPTIAVKEKLDSLFYSYQCTQFWNAYKKVQDSHEVKKKLSQYEDFKNYIINSTGYPIKNTNSFSQLYYMIESQMSLGLALPEWCSEDVLKTLRELVKFDRDVESWLPEMRRVYGGQVIKQFIENMNVNNKTVNRRKIYLYCGHDNTIAAFARGLKIPHLEVPAYGSAVIMEKHSDENDKLYVKIFVWTGVTEEMHLVKLPDCDELCPMEEFLRLTEANLPTASEANCLFEKLNFDDLKKPSN